VRRFPFLPENSLRPEICDVEYSVEGNLGLTVAQHERSFSYMGDS